MHLPTETQEDDDDIQDSILTWFGSKRVSTILGHRRLSSKTPLAMERDQQPTTRIGLIQKYYNHPVFGSIFGSWQERRLEIDERQLKYYKLQGNEGPVLDGILNFDMY